MVDKITHRNAMAHFQFDPFAHAPRERCTVAALRAEAADVDTVTRVGRPADERDLETWRKLTTVTAVEGDAPVTPARQTSIVMPS